VYLLVTKLEQELTLKYQFKFLEKNLILALNHFLPLKKIQIHLKSNFLTFFLIFLTTFYRAKTDIFTITMPDLGDLKKITMAIDGSGFGSDWSLDTVSIKNETTGAQWWFTYKIWLKDTKPHESVASTTPPKPAMDPKAGTSSKDVKPAITSAKDVKGTTPATTPAPTTGATTTGTATTPAPTTTTTTPVTAPTTATTGTAPTTATTGAQSAPVPGNTLL
jgi:hypothetical protein